MAVETYIFSAEQGNYLIRLVVAHLLGDFVFQTKKMVENKKWLSKEMGLHISIVYGLTALFTGWWWTSWAIALTHYTIDGLKIEGQKRHWPTLRLFLLDQFLHVLVLLSLWALHFQLLDSLLEVARLPLTDYKISLLLMGYLLVTTPVGFLIKFSIQHIPMGTIPQRGKGGQTIGIFERLIILTFVLLNQYEAIGFLITGKSIIRFANQEEHIRSEYVLVGTMMSYGISILVGVFMRYLLSF